MTSPHLEPEAERSPPPKTPRLHTNKKKSPSSTGGAPKSGGAKSKKVAQDDQVMATNNSSIVSKRSVEKFYYPDETHYFRFFVKKLQRRAPLINRGYHLRLHVIDVLVRNFLRGGECIGKTKKKVVVNLGCGSDVLPWQCLHRYPEHCQAGLVKFVDVDFPDLIERKRQTVLNTPELLGALTAVQENPSSGPVVFESDQYAQIGCDLRELDKLQTALAATLGDLSECSFIFVAEVSITYMETIGADNVIKWASSLGNAEFVLLEQILPSGPDHPFASTMLSHFHKLNTQLKSVHVYPTVEDQRSRFSCRGWNTVDVWTLWQTWSDERFLSPDDRCRLELVEAFDEWEEFALFASHYCVVHARISPATSNATTTLRIIPKDVKLSVAETKVALQFDECLGQRGQRRFGGAMLLTPQDEKNGSDNGCNGDSSVLVNVMGLGTKSRLQSCDVFVRQTEASDGTTSGGSTWFMNSLNGGDGGPTTRMCHSLADLGPQGRGGKVRGYLLSGGRDSPAKAFRDCWMFEGDASAWKRTHDLPTPLYRHSVTGLHRESNMALLVGGKGPEGVFGGCLVHQPGKGWVSCEVIGGVGLKPVYGATICCFRRSNSAPEVFCGIYAGGLLDDGVIADQILSWELNIANPEKPTIRFEPLQISAESVSLSDGSILRRLMPRFGASCFPYGNGKEFVILGGVTAEHLLDHRDEVLLCSVDGQNCHITQRLVGKQSSTDSLMPRPLLTGHSAVLTPEGQVVVAGGGATCFSMGTFWNKGVYTLGLPILGASLQNVFTENSEPLPHWVHEITSDIIPGQPSLPRAQEALENGTAEKRNHLDIKSIPRIKLESKDDFSRIVREGKPVVLEGLDLGSCTANWTIAYLIDKVGADRKVVVHESSNQAMDFNAKNFRYVTTNFADFGQRVEKGDRLYLRALSSDLPTEKPAMLSDDFSALAADFVLPQELSLVEDNMFSSVLRVSGPVNMWLHYDVMANVYCQLGGSKRLVLFPPSDVEHLAFSPGASSSSIDVFALLRSENESEKLAQTHPHEATLSPGDILFLPPLWLHTATPTSECGSIAVNVFFKDLDSGAYAAGRDVYGNRDLAAYEKGRQDVARIANSFSSKKIPDEVRQFYLLRLADELRRKALGYP
ncbi:hypothetical protein V8F06_002581 [Rhypophila decipiens]